MRCKIPKPQAWGWQYGVAHKLGIQCMLYTVWHLPVKRAPRGPRKLTVISGHINMIISILIYWLICCRILRLLDSLFVLS